MPKIGLTPASRQSVSSSIRFRRSLKLSSVSLPTSIRPPEAVLSIALATSGMSGKPWSAESATRKVPFG